jgi:hypothetical protein
MSAVLPNIYTHIIGERERYAIEAKETENTIRD